MPDVHPNLVSPPEAVANRTLKPVVECRPPNSWRTLLLVVFLALVTRVALCHRQVPSDGRRFLAEARQLLAGEGFGRKGRLEPHLPPGYPIFLAGVISVHDSLTTIRFVQIGLSVASCVLVYTSIRPFSHRFALVSAFAMSLSPVLAYHTGVIMSETFGTFLMSVFVFGLMRERTTDHAHGVLLVLIGMTACALVLTSPATAFLCAFVILAIVWACRTRLVWLLSLATGVLCLMIPWQIHQISATGNVVPLVYDSRVLRPPAGLASWVSSWLIDPADVWAYHCVRGAEAFDRKVPARAFRSEDERRQLRQLCIAVADGKIDPAACDAVFGRVAESRYRESPLRCGLVNPLLRCLTVWLCIDALWPAQVSYCGRCTPQTFLRDWEQFNFKRATLRLGKGLYSSGVIVLNAGYALFFFWLMARGVRSRKLLAVAVVLGVLGYTWAGARFATHEVRRNQVFYPALLFMGGMTMARTVKRKDSLGGSISHERVRWAPKRASTEPHAPPPGVPSPATLVLRMPYACSQHTAPVLT